MVFSKYGEILSITFKVICAINIANGIRNKKGVGKISLKFIWLKVIYLDINTLILIDIYNYYLCKFLPIKN
ncbi:hypothetical protein PSHI8_02980 [Polynucleobacter sp. SHI8]|nr:hypothetical protein PSHI2_02980 [Polynucleobacter sp. SHI2]BDW12662.1 hypothetical protein PSHI8_02980 [Polynucleobacter sp. SHI8]